MTTPTDTPTAWAAWKARCLELAEVLVDAARDYGKESEQLRAMDSYGSPDGSPIDSARAALEAHLDAVPVGPVVAWVGSDSVRSMSRMSDRGSCTTTLYKVPQDDMDCVPLCRHPKESA